LAPLFAGSGKEQ